MKSRIYYSKPSITNREIKYVNDAMQNGWGAECNGYIERFEDGFKEFIGTEYALATSSCTGALHMGLAALGIGSGDEVILADINWVATLAPILYLGAKPVLVDINKDSWCIDPKEVLNAITKNTKAIIVTHIYGNLCDMDRLLEIGDAMNIPVIEDAAEAIGSLYKKQWAGSMGKFGVFSFHGTKTMSTGEGGMLVTNDLSLYSKARILNNHGRGVKSEQFKPDMLGYKYKMTNLQAAMGCGQLARRWELIERKRDIFYAYKRRIGGIDGITMNPIRTYNTLSGYWMPTVVFDDGLVDRAHLLARMAVENIDSRVFFPPLSSLKFMGECKGNINAYDISCNGINLPSYHDMTDDDIDRVCDVIRKEVKSCKR
jgi:perosamine synthetase